MLTTKENAIHTIQSHNGEFAEVKNPSYVFPPKEYYPLAPRLKTLKQLKAAMMDMDGTTTTTEVLCIYALEWMVRRMSGKLTTGQWHGIDHETDLAWIIGNSTTKHVEYLLSKYQTLLNHQHTAAEFLRSAYWTLNYSQDEQRKKEVTQNLRKLGLEKALQYEEQRLGVEDFIQTYSPRVGETDLSMQVSLGIDIYYEIYHQILLKLRNGRGDEVRREVFGDANSDEELISPMPGIPFFIPLLKGWLGEEAELFAPGLVEEYEKETDKTLSEEEKTTFTQKLIVLGKAFEAQPAKVALVTSSIFYEADIIIQEVLRVMGRFIEKSNLSAQRKKAILNAYEDYHQVYDAFVTASDSSEIRLKPHRDLYSIALHKTGLMPQDFDKVIGFEDSQSGTVAMRAAGIGCCIAVPFAQTLTHDLSAATHILPGGIPELVVEHGVFLE